MALIHVPRPENAGNQNRPISSLLKNQIRHLHEAEHNLPLRYRSDKYVHAIKTEAEAAAYIRHVTDAVHRAHADAAAERERGGGKPISGKEIAAAAEPTPPPPSGATQGSNVKPGKGPARRGRKK